MIVILIVILLAVYIFFMPMKGTALLVVLSPLLSVMSINNIGIVTLLSMVSIIGFLRTKRFNLFALKNPFLVAVLFMALSATVSNYFSAQRHFIPLATYLIECVMILITYKYSINGGGVFSLFRQVPQSI